MNSSFLPVRHLLNGALEILCIRNTLFLTAVTDLSKHWSTSLLGENYSIIDIWLKILDQPWLHYFIGNSDVSSIVIHENVVEGEESRNERHGPSFELHCNTDHPASREAREQLPVHYRIIGNRPGERDSHWLARTLIGSQGTLCWQEYVMQMQVTAHCTWVSCMALQTFNPPCLALNSLWNVSAHSWRPRFLIAPFSWYVRDHPLQPLPQGGYTWCKK